MTYTVSSGTLNSSLPYHTVRPSTYPPFSRRRESLEPSPSDQRTHLSAPEQSEGHNSVNSGHERERERETHERTNEGRHGQSGSGGCDWTTSQTSVPAAAAAENPSNDAVIDNGRCREPVEIQPEKNKRNQIARADQWKAQSSRISAARTTQFG